MNTHNEANIISKYVLYFQNSMNRVWLNYSKNLSEFSGGDNFVVNFGRIIRRDVTEDWKNLEQKIINDFTHNT